MWPNWPPSLPSPELLRHLYGFTVVLLICDAETLFLGLTSFLCSIHMQIVYSTRRLSWIRLPCLPVIRNSRLFPYSMRYVRSEASTQQQWHRPLFLISTKCPQVWDVPLSNCAPHVTVCSVRRNLSGTISDQRAETWFIRWTTGKISQRDCGTS